MSVALILPVPTTAKAYLKQPDISLVNGIGHLRKRLTVLQATNIKDNLDLSHKTLVPGAWALSLLQVPPRVPETCSGARL